MLGLCRGGTLGVFAGLVVWAAAAAPVRAEVIVAGTGTLEAALEDVSDGGIVLVKPGSYTGSYLIDGKGLTLVAEAGAEITLERLTIRNVPADATVYVRGFHVGTTGALTADKVHPTLEVQAGAGSVWIEDTLVVGHDGANDSDIGGFFSQAPGSPALVVTGASVVLERVTLTGGRGGSSTMLSPGKAGGVGLLLHDGARAVLHASTTQGGQPGNSPGSSGGQSQPNIGGDGVHATGDAFVALAGSSALGGNGAQGALSQGGAGCRFEGTGTLWLREAVTLGGLGAFGIYGDDLDAGTADVVMQPSPVGTLAVSSPLREGEVGTLAIGGQPGQPAFLLVGFAAQFAPLPAREGVLLPDTAALLTFPLGTLGPGGDLVLPVLAPNLPAVVEGLTFPVQLATMNGGTARLDAASALVVLDAAIP